MRRATGFVFALCGAAAVVLGIVASVASPAQVAANAPSAVPATFSPQPSVAPAASAAPTLAPTATPSPTPATLVDGWRVEVPRLGIDLPLRDGDLARDVVDQSTPVNAAFRLPGSAYPGTSGNLYVYAHARVGMFLSLWSARAGDEVRLLGPNGTMLRYVVTEIAPRVPVTDLTYLLPTDDERLTLQTSTGPRVGDPRFVVVALPQRP